MEYNFSGDIISRKPAGIREEIGEALDANGCLECVIYFPRDAWESAREEGVEAQVTLISKYTYPQYGIVDAEWYEYEDQEEEPREDVECVQVHTRVWFEMT